MRRLALQHAENQIGLGLAVDGNLVEIFAARNGSWTIVVTMPDGTSCIRAWGTEWMGLSPGKGYGPGGTTG